MISIIIGRVAVIIILIIVVATPFKCLVEPVAKCEQQLALELLSVSQAFITFNEVGIMDSYMACIRIINWSRITSIDIGTPFTK